MSVRDSFVRQAQACLSLGSPFTARLCEVLAGKLDGTSRFGSRILDWQGDPVHAALPLRAAGGLHALARSGASPQLRAVYPPNQSDDDRLWAAIEGAIRNHDAFLAGYLDSAPQTNEVARSSAILGACLHLAGRTGMPIDVYEIGSSAGLNLAFDRYRFDFGAAAWNGDSSVEIRSQWRGNAPDTSQELLIGSRQGCDLNPLDPASARDRERLLSYVWADQEERLRRISQALSLAAEARYRVERQGAAAWLVEKLRMPRERGRTRLLFHTIVWQYLDEDTKAGLVSAIFEAGDAATEDTPFAWLAIEPDDVPGSAGIGLTLWPGERSMKLGRADFHGRWAEWA
jgi:hypothetical protein